MEDYKEHIKFVRDNKKNINKILKKYINDCIKLEKKDAKNVNISLVAQIHILYIIYELINILSNTSDSIDENTSNKSIYKYIQSSLLNSSSIEYQLFTYIYHNTKNCVYTSPYIITECKENKQISDEDILNDILNKSGLIGRIKNIAIRMIIKLLQKISVKMKNVCIIISKKSSFINEKHIDLILRNMNDFSIDYKLFVHISETANKIKNAL